MRFVFKKETGVFSAM